MKIEQEKSAFQPISIILESMDDARNLWRIISVVNGGKLTSDAIEMRRILLNKLESI